MTSGPPQPTPDRIFGPPPVNEDLVGLALSGGGVRSATFGLGALQAFEKLKMLRLFDYMSTVSGGGFVGGWWSAWLARDERDRTDVFPELEELEPARKPAELLSGAPSGGPPPGLPDGALSAERRDPIHHLRLFSNYLTPRRGALSADTWRGIAFYARTLLMTWLALLPLLLGAILLAQLYYVGDWARLFVPTLRTGIAATAFVCAQPDKVEEPDPSVPLGKAVGGTGATIGSAHPPAKLRPMLLNVAACNQPAPALHNAVLGERVWYAAIPLLLLGGIMIVVVALWVLHSTEAPGAALFGMAGAVAIVVPLVRSFMPPGGAGFGHLLLTVVGFGIVTALVHLCLVVWIDFVGVSLTKWKISHDVHRARLAQWHALLLKITVIAGLLLAIAGFGHEVVWFLAHPDGGTLPRAARQAGGWGALLLATASAAFTAYKALPTGRAKDSSEQLSPATRAIIRLAPYVVVLTLAVLLAWASHSLLTRWALRPPDTFNLAWLVLVASTLQLGFSLYEWVRDLLKDGRDSPVGTSLIGLSTGAVALLASIGARYWFGHGHHPGGSGTYSVLATCSKIGFVFTVAFIALELARRGTGWMKWKLGAWELSALNGRSMLLMLVAATSFGGQLVFHGAVPDPDHAASFTLLSWSLGALVVLSAAWVVGLGWMADPNLLSMHAFYEARLVRGYLGASNLKRGTEITDTARGDDVLLTDLWNHDQAMPYHLINTTLNLVSAPDLATSQRSAANFVLSKYYCGSARTGYQRTKDYMDGQLTLGAAVATSGAAASPNMGSKTQGAALAALLALLNVRLGFWAPNPRLRRWRERQARLWPFYLVHEFLSQTNDNGTYCYLTDGGHFDNTGIYALVERGCRYIVVLDCGADPGLKFEDIGQAIRRCRIDFGTEITLKVSKFLERDPSDPDKKRLKRRHVVVGDIVYNKEHWRMLGLNDPDRTGCLVWIKPAVVEGDAADVRQYQRQNAAFPHQTTLDQWYDESQFEAYRQLGYDSVLTFFPSDVPAPGNRQAIRAYFDRLATP